MGFKKNYVFVITVLFFLIIPVLFRLIFSSESHFELRKIIVFRLDSLMYGVLGAYIFRHYFKIWDKYKFPALVMSIFIVVFLAAFNKDANSKFWKVFFFNLESMATLLALPYFSRLSGIKSRRLALAFTFISLISYSMYILNLSVIEWRVIPGLLSLLNLVQIDKANGGIVSFLFFWPLVFIGSFLLYKFYEHPMMNLRKGLN